MQIRSLWIVIDTIFIKISENIVSRVADCNYLVILKVNGVLKTISNFTFFEATVSRDTLHQPKKGNAFRTFPFALSSMKLEFHLIYDFKKDLLIFSN